MALPTVVASGSWNDFSVKTKQLITLSQVIPIGHRAVFVLTSTVDGGVAPNAVNYGGIDDTLYDTNGNTWHRDLGSLVDATDVFTTTEAWSTFVNPTTDLPTSGFGLDITPDARGLSAHWALLDVPGTLEDSTGTVSPFDSNSVAAIITPGNTTWTTASMTLLTSDEVVISLFGGSPGVSLPGLPWATDTAGFTSLVQLSNATPGSNLIFAVFAKEVLGGGSVQSTITKTAASTGTGLILAYKRGTAASVAYPTARVMQSRAAVQTAAATTLSDTFTNATVTGRSLIVEATDWKTGGADTALAVSDNKSTVFTATQAAPPATAAGARSRLWIGKITGGGASHQVTVTANASSEITLRIMEVDGLAGTVDQKAKAGPTTSATIAAGSITPTAAGELVVMVSTEDLGSTTINPQSWVAGADIGANQDMHSLWQIQSAAAAVNPALPILGGSGSWAAQIASFPASSAAAAPLRPSVPFMSNGRI